LAAWIGRVEFRNSFDPTQGFVIVVPVETAYLGSDALSDRGQSRVRHDETQFPQPSPTPALAHHSHPFGGCRHFALRASSNIATVTRYGHCGNSREHDCFTSIMLLPCFGEQVGRFRSNQVIRSKATLL
jgi:hypothetical protein